MPHPVQAIRRRGAKPAQIICASFVLVILAGTLLLLLPFSTYEGLSFTNALFTATSATCVTGLIVVNTYTAFTPFGQAVILLLIQIGGLGLVTLTSFFALAMRRRMGFRGLRLVGESVSADGYSQAATVLRAIIRLALTFEVMGAVLLMFAFVPEFGPEGIWVSVFLSISAFCNAGFDLLGRAVPFASLTAYVNNYYVQLIIMLLIIAGGLGFSVWMELGEYRRSRKISLHAHLVLLFSVIFWVGGALAFGLIEWNNAATLGPLSLPGKLMASLFQSVSTRTAGFNTVDLAACHPLAKLAMSILMFVGAAPGGTGGGIKLTTFAVLAMTIRSVAFGREECIIHGHRIDHKIVYRALSIITLGGLVVIIATVAGYYMTGTPVSEVDSLFESVSAFATVGLSIGVTGVLNTGAKYLYMVVMFIGRVGPVSLAISLAERPDALKGKILPEGHLNVG